MRRLPIVAALSLWLAVSPITIAAQSRADWLDRPLVGWNSAGMALPAVTARESGPSEATRCGGEIRWPETEADGAVTAAGWNLSGPYRAGWGIVAVDALSGHDGMCRPLGFQTFVFVDSAYAGTISPVPMDSRTDGAGSVTSISPDSLSASFTRYASTDPLCCPSRQPTYVRYRIDRTPAGPVLVPESASSGQVSAPSAQARPASVELERVEQLPHG